jgi:hypothetical protein
MNNEVASNNMFLDQNHRFFLLIASLSLDKKYLAPAPLQADHELASDKATIYYVKFQTASRMAAMPMPPAVQIEIRPRPFPF